MKRIDGRRHIQHRDIGVRIDRDVLFSFGLSKVYSALEYGSQNRSSISVRVIIEENAYPPTVSSSRRDRISEEYERIIEGIFLPVILDSDSTYSIICRIICDKGSILSALINSTSLLLLSYKVPIKYMIFSTTVGLSPDNHLEYIVDLTEAEEKGDLSYITVAMGYNKREKILSYGALSKPVSDKAFLDILEYSTEIVRVISDEIVKIAKSTKI